MTAGLLSRRTPVGGGRIGAKRIADWQSAIQQTGGLRYDDAMANQRYTIEE